MRYLSRRKVMTILGALVPAVLLGRPAAAGPAGPMGALEAIKTRRSVRKYTSEPVEDQLLEEVLRCGMQAPSACNEQPWQFVVIRDKKTLEAVGGINRYAGFARNAPVAVLVCGDKRLDKCEGYWVQDCSNCAENMLLAAHALGLGAVWTGIYPLPDRIEGFRKLCALPQEVTPLALLVVGWPAETPKPEDRYDTTRIHRDKW